MSQTEDDLIAAYLKTDAGKARFREAILHGWPDMRTALQMHYIPILVDRARRRGKA